MPQVRTSFARASPARAESVSGLLTISFSCALAGSPPAIEHTATPGEEANKQTNTQTHPAGLGTGAAALWHHSACVAVSGPLQPLQPPSPCCNVQLCPRGPAHSGAPHAGPHARAAAHGRERGGRAERRRSAGAPVLRPHAIILRNGMRSHERERQPAAAHAARNSSGTLAAAARARDADQAELVLAFRARLGVLRARVRPLLRRGLARIRAAQRPRRDWRAHICARSAAPTSAPGHLRHVSVVLHPALTATSARRSHRSRARGTSCGAPQRPPPSTRHESAPPGPCQDSPSSDWPPTSAPGPALPFALAGTRSHLRHEPPRLGSAGRN